MAILPVPSRRLDSSQLVVVGSASVQALRDGVVEQGVDDAVLLALGPRGVVVCAILFDGVRVAVTAPRLPSHCVSGQPSL